MFSTEKPMENQSFKKIRIIYLFSISTRAEKRYMASSRPLMTPLISSRAFNVIFKAESSPFEVVVLCLDSQQFFF